MSNNKQSDAKFWITQLALEPTDLGGVFGPGDRSTETITASCLPDRFDGDHDFYSTNYFLLAAGVPSVSRLALHQLKQDEQWFFFKGDGLILHIFKADNSYERIAVGDKVQIGECLMAVAPANSWFGAELINEDSFAVSGCSLAPGWEPSDSTLPNDSDLTQFKRNFPDLIAIINRLTQHSA
jgi:predicted cupin superfamily sugar epimerase